MNFSQKMAVNFTDDEIKKLLSSESIVNRYAEVNRVFSQKKVESPCEIKLKLRWRVRLMDWVSRRLEVAGLKAVKEYDMRFTTRVIRIAIPRKDNQSPP